MGMFQAVRAKRVRAGIVRCTMEHGLALEARSHLLHVDGSQVRIEFLLEEYVRCTEHGVVRKIVGRCTIVIIHSIRRCCGATYVVIVLHEGLFVPDFGGNGENGVVVCSHGHVGVLGAALGEGTGGVGVSGDEGLRSVLTGSPAASIGSGLARAEASGSDRVRAGRDDALGQSSFALLRS